MVLKIQAYFSKLSLLFLTVPYIVISSIDNAQFLEAGFPLLTLLILTIDLFLLKINSKWFNFIVLIFLLYFLYSLIVYNDTYYSIHKLSFTNFSILFLIFFSIIFYFLIFKNQNFAFINSIILIFSLLQLFNFDKNISTQKIFKNYNISSNFIDFKGAKSNSNDPVILIVCDELTSSNEIFKSTKKLIDLEFDNFLKQNNYEILSGFESKSTWTQFSISSLFNFNLHYNDTIQNLESRNSNEIFMNDFSVLIEQNLLVDSLKKYGVKSHSFGILPFKNGEKVNDAIYLWNVDQFNFDIEFIKDYKLLQIIFKKSVLNFIDSRFLNGRTYSFDSDRKNTLDQLKNQNFDKNNFYYFHYFAPHSPHSYFNEFKYKPNDHLNENIFDYHVTYRRFMLNKLMQVLSSNKFENARIIITGDHGLRSDLTNFNASMAAFKGFDKEQINELRNVQDIGTLIFYSLTK